MTIPHMLPAPPVLTQAPARCWSAAFEIWSQANQQHLGLPLAPAQEDLIRWLSSGGGYLTAAGRARQAGVDFMGNIGLMRIERMPSRQVTLDLLDRKLNEGYVYCAYYWNTARGGRLGHAVVIHGVEAGTIHFSDPAPGRGLVHEAASFFQHEGVAVTLGTSLLVSLRRGIQTAFSRLEPGGTL